MRLKIGIYLIVGIGIAISIGVLASISSQPEEEGQTVFHVTLADPSLYQNGVYSERFEIEEGMYFFNFVPNGDSPQILTIALKGDSFSFSEDFKLKGTLHETGISNYYTWDFEGAKMIQIHETQELEVTINPHADVLGSVSVELIEQ